MTIDELNQDIKDLRVRMDILEKFAQELEDSDKGWKPEDREEYYYIGSDMNSYFTSCWGDDIDKAILGSGNCFKTEEQATEAARRVKQVLQDYRKELYG